MERTPDEIKAGLECCKERDCNPLWRKCPYGELEDCSVLLLQDTLTYIRQLEAYAGKDKDVPRKKIACPATGRECYECKPGGPCAKER